MSFFSLFFAALQFITRIPVPDKWAGHYSELRQTQMVVTFPLVGLVIGGLSALIYLAGYALFNEFIASIFVVIFVAMITGGFHFDGLADTADGLFSSRNRDQMLEIMRDSRIGSNGTLALVFAVLLHVFAIYTISTVETVTTTCFFLIVAPIVSRTLAVVLLMYKQHYARSDGLANGLIGRINGMDCLTTLLFGLVLVWVISGLNSVGYVALTACLGWLYRIFINARLGGQTGDTLGAGIVLCEIVFLLTA